VDGFFAPFLHQGMVWGEVSPPASCLCAPRVASPSSAGFQPHELAHEIKRFIKKPISVHEENDSHS
jgi:hypothetical protein